MPMKRRLRPDEIVEYQESQGRADGMADSFVRIISGSGRRDGTVDTAAALHALTLVSAFVLNEVMACFPEEDPDRDGIVAEFLNNVRRAAYKEGKVDLAIHSIGKNPYDEGKSDEGKEGESDAG